MGGFIQRLVRIFLHLCNFDVIKLAAFRGTLKSRGSLPLRLALVADTRSHSLA